MVPDGSLFAGPILKDNSHGFPPSLSLGTLNNRRTKSGWDLKELPQAGGTSSLFGQDCF